VHLGDRPGHPNQKKRHTGGNEEIAKEKSELMKTEREVPKKRHWLGGTGSGGMGTRIKGESAVEGTRTCVFVVKKRTLNGSTKERPTLVRSIFTTRAGHPTNYLRANDGGSRPEGILLGVRRSTHRTPQCRNEMGEQNAVRAVSNKGARKHFEAIDEKGERVRGRHTQGGREEGLSTANE